MPRRLVTRSDLRRALVFNALSKPVNVAVPAGVLVASALLGAWWLAAVAVACWLALAANTFFDEAEARRTGERLHASRRRDRADPPVDPGAFTPLIGGRVKAAIEARASILEAIDAAPFPLADVAHEVDALVAAMEADAVRAQRIHVFLSGQESAVSLERRIERETHEPVRAALEAKHRALSKLRERLAGHMAELDEVVATLQTVQAEIFAAEGIEEELAERAIAGQVSDLRAQVELVSAGLEEAFAETRARGAP